MPKGAIGRLYSIKDYRFLPVEARGDRPITDERLSPRHHLPAPLQSEPPGVISEVQFVAMLRAARSNRDRFLLSVMHDCGLRVGEALAFVEATSTSSRTPSSWAVNSRGRTSTSTAGATATGPSPSHRDPGRSRRHRRLSSGMASTSSSATGFRALADPPTCS